MLGQGRLLRLCRAFSPAEKGGGVYLMAAGGSLSTDPKLPCPSMRGACMVKSCAMRTRESYTAVSPWGWYLPSTSPTTRAHFLSHALSSGCCKSIASMTRDKLGLLQNGEGVHLGCT